MARIETDSSCVSPTASRLSSLAQVSQTQDSVENEFEGIDEEVNTTNDDDANNKTNIGADIDDIDLIGGILTSGDGTSSMPYMKAFITDPEKLKPVQMQMTIKKRKNDLLERLMLSRVKFSDNEHDALYAMEDPKSPY